MIAAVCQRFAIAVSVLSAFTGCAPIESPTQSSPPTEPQVQQTSTSEVIEFLDPPVPSVGGTGLPDLPSAFSDSGEIDCEQAESLCESGEFDCDDIADYCDVGPDGPDLPDYVDWDS